MIVLLPYSIIHLFRLLSRQMNGTRAPKKLKNISEEYLRSRTRDSKQLVEIIRNLNVELSVQRNKQRSANDEIGNLRLERYNLNQRMAKLTQEKAEIERLYRIWLFRAKTLEASSCHCQNGLKSNKPEGMKFCEKNQSDTTDG